MPTHSPRWIAAFILGALFLAAPSAWAQVECLDRYDLEDGIGRLAKGADQVTLPMLSRCVNDNATWVVADIQALRRNGLEGVPPRNDRDRRAARDRGKQAIWVKVEGSSVVIGVKRRAALFLTSNQVYTWFFTVTFTPKGRATSGAAGGELRTVGEFSCTHFIYLTRETSEGQLQLTTSPADPVFSQRVRLKGRGVTGKVKLVSNKHMGALINDDLTVEPHYTIFRWNPDTRDGIVQVELEAQIAGVASVHSLYLKNVCPAPPVARRNGFGVRFHAGMPFVGAGLGLRREYTDWRWSGAVDLLYQHPLNVLFPDKDYENTLNVVFTPRLGTQNLWMGISVGMALRDVSGAKEPMMVAMPHVTIMGMGGTLGVTIGAAYYGLKNTKMQPMVGLEFDLMGSSDQADPSTPQFTNRLTPVDP